MSERGERFDAAVTVYEAAQQRLLDAGYGQCREGAVVNLQCCKDCQHPGYRAAQPNQWTADELDEMWAGREMPEYIAREVRKLRAR